MSDNFRHHSDDWSRVPRPEAIQPLPYQDYTVEPMIRLDNYYTAQVYAEPVVPVQRVFVSHELSVGVAYVLWLLLGLIGAHYFYMGKVGVGVLWLLTGGLLGVGWFFDLFTLKGQVERENARRRGW